MRWQGLTRMKIREIGAAVAAAVLILIPSAPAGADEPHLVVAKNFLAFRGSDKEIASVEELRFNRLEPGAQEVLAGWLVRLYPAGYLLISASTEHMPVKAYSLEHDYDRLPERYRGFLERELEIYARLGAREAGGPGRAIASVENSARKAWEFLLGYRPRVTPQEYVPETALLTTVWGQGYPYNKHLPEVEGELTLAGCVNTALAQVMRYHAHPEMGRGIAATDWEGQTLEALLGRRYHWDNMPDNLGMASPEYQQDEVAMLIRDLAVVNHTDLSPEYSSASFRPDAFVRHFGYSSGLSSMENSEDGFFETLKSEIDSELPVLLSLPGHMTVVDGYRDDQSGNWFHINMGWRGLHDDYYNLDEPIEVGDYTFSPDLTVYYGIKPCTVGDCVSPDAVAEEAAPRILNEFEDRVLEADPEESVRLRVDARDANGDQVSLRLRNTNPGALDAALEDDVLTLTPKAGGGGQSALIEIRAFAGGDSDYSSFRVLITDARVAYGTSFDLTGEFQSIHDVFSHRAYLQGPCTLAGDRGYSNQAFFIQVEDSEGEIVVPFMDQAVEGDFQGGIYDIKAALSSEDTYYKMGESGHEQYVIRAACPESGISTEGIADLLDVDLGGTISVMGDLDGDLDVTLKDAIVALKVLARIPEDNADASQEVDGDGRIGLAEAAYILKYISGKD